MRLLTVPAIMAAISLTALPNRIGWAEPRAVTVWAAGSLKEALLDVAARYAKATGAAANFKFGLSADLARQIETKGGAQIFISTAKPLVDSLASKGHVEKDSIVSPVGNGLVLIAPASSSIAPDLSTIINLPSLLGAGEKLSTGDPAYVALGIYAMEALTKLGEWPALESRLLRADSVQAALELVETDAAPLGIVFSTTAASSNKVKVLAHFPRGTYTPIRYTFAMVRGEGKEEVRKLFAYLIGPEALAIYATYGFIIEN